jgi:hypothetical protein
VAGHNTLGHLLNVQVIDIISIRKGQKDGVG